VKIFGGGGKSAYLCTRFREASELPRTEGRPVTARGSCYTADAGHNTDTDRNSETEAMQKKVEEKFGSCRFSSYLCKVFPPHENRRPTGHGKRGREIPEDIERLTIDKDKKVQELIK